MPSLNWIGKHAVVNHHKEIPFRLLKCRDDLSAGDSDSGNLLVQGDNLEALKALLPYYAGQVKCIFIDPPYNTGNEGWIYNDAVNSPEMRSWLGNVVGGEAEDLSRHDKWLCMMYPRLALLREFLTDDGSLWMTLDDNEVHYAKLILDEIFGSTNFVSNVIWEKSDSPKMDSRHFSARHDHLLVYAKNIDRLYLNRIVGDGVAEHYNKVDESGRSYYLKPLRAMGGQGDSRIARPNLYFPLYAPDGTIIYPKKQDGSDGAWRWSREKIEQENQRIEWVQGKNGWSPYFRIYSDTSTGRPPETIWKHEDVGSNRTSKVEIKSIFPDKVSFDTPKPSRLIQRIVQLATGPNDYILDSFAGSGTTGHAVLKQNIEDGGNRHFILVEMDTNIAPNITAERLRRVIQGYTYKEHRGNERSEPGLGGGFRFCDLGDTLFDPAGPIRKEVSYEDLAQHIYFIETGSPLPRSGTKQYPLLGINNNQAVYLLYNGILKDKSPQGGNVLTYAVLDTLPPHNGPMVIYGTGSRISDVRLDEMGVIFKQIPYEIKAN